MFSVYSYVHFWGIILFELFWWIHLVELFLVDQFDWIVLDGLFLDRFILDGFSMDFCRSNLLRLIFPVGCPRWILLRWIICRRSFLPWIVFRWILSRLMFSSMNYVMDLFLVEFGIFFPRRFFADEFFVGGCFVGGFSVFDSLSVDSSCWILRR